MGRTERVRSLLGQEPEPQSAGLRQARSLLRKNSSPGAKAPQPRWGDLLSTVDYVCGLERSRLGTTGYLHSSAEPYPFDGVQVNAEPGRRASALEPLSTSSSVHLPVANSGSPSLQEFANGAQQAGGRAGGFTSVPWTGSTYLALHRQLGNAA